MRIRPRAPIMAIESRLRRDLWDAYRFLHASFRQRASFRSISRQTKPANKELTQPRNMLVNILTRPYGQ